MAAPVGNPQNRDISRTPVPLQGSGRYKRDRNSLRRRIRDFLNKRWVHFLLIAIGMTGVSQAAHWTQVALWERVDKFGLNRYFKMRAKYSPNDIAERPNTKDIILVETPHAIPRPIVAKLIDRLRLAKVVAFDFMFVDNERAVLKDEKEFFQPQIAGWRKDDDVFMAALRRNKNVILGAWPEAFNSGIAGLTPQVESTKTGEAAASEKTGFSLQKLKFKRTPEYLNWERPPAKLWNSAKYQAHLLVDADIEDNIVRQVALMNDVSTLRGQGKPEYRPSLGLAMAAAYLGVPAAELYKIKPENGILKLGSRSIPVGTGDFMTIDYVGDRTSFESMANHTSYLQVLNGFQDPKEFAGKIVIVGEVSLKSKEIFLTPLGEMPGMQIHAHIASTLLSDVGPPQELHWAVVALISIFFAGLLVAPLGRWTLASTFLLAFAEVAFAFFLVGGYIFYAFHAILPASVPIGAVVLTLICIALSEYRQVRKALATYIGKEMVKPTLQTVMQLELGGYRQVATALQCDLRGYSGLTEIMEVGELMTVMNEYTELMAQVMHRYNGRIIDFQGDGAFVLFEEQFAGKDFALKATQAAVEMRHEFYVLRSEWAEPAASSVDVGIGLDTGELMIGNVGAKSHMKLGAIGDAVNVAARVQRLSSQCGYNVLITLHTYERLHGALEARSCGIQPVRGRNQAVEIFGVGDPIMGVTAPQKAMSESLN